MSSFDLISRAVKKTRRVVFGSLWAVINENKFSAFREWGIAAYASPSPYFIKQACVLRHGITDSTFIETGTYLGDTTALLGSVGRQVVSLEPDLTLFEAAELRFINNKRVEIIHGSSEMVFPTLMPTLSGDVSFWLDGHYSAGRTFRGQNDTPIMLELNEIGKNLSNFGKVAIMVDDIRCFDPTLPGFESYPSRSYLVNWADSLGFNWTIEHDIFVAKNFDGSAL